MTKGIIIYMPPRDWDRIPGWGDASHQSLRQSHLGRHGLAVVRNLDQTIAVGRNRFTALFIDRALQSIGPEIGDSLARFQAGDNVCK